MNSFVVTRSIVNDEDNYEDTVIGVYSTSELAHQALIKYKEKHSIVMDDFLVEKFEVDSEAGMCEDSWIY